MKEIIKTLLVEWKERQTPIIFDRDVNLEEYAESIPNKIIAVTGFRRTGKTYSMMHLINGLLKENTKENIIYINFEDERIPEKTEFLTQLIPTISELFKGELKFLFLDEIQNIPNWSKWLRRAYDNENIRFFVSGSSSKMSSKEIPTELRGRFLEVKMFPLSFKEFLRFKGIEFDLETINYSDKQKSKLLRHLNEFHEYGALPEIVLAEEGRKVDIANSYYQTVVRRDIIERYNIKNEEALKALLRLLLNSTRYSISKMYNNLKALHHDVGKTTLQKYIGYIENSFFMFSVPIFSYKIKDQMQYARKNYFVDAVFISKLSSRFTKDLGRLYENTFAIDLKRRNKEFYYWENLKKQEVDFVIVEGGKVKHLIQICYNIDDLDTRKREIRSLIQASRELKCKNLIVITHDYESESEEEWFGIRRKIKFIPLWQWFLSGTYHENP
ncbi:MAG: ATP-binding protein [DPANN group archaeon]|nr:ATP-binding protein [DPANN group archaeon]